ncbi:MAG: hypothetical protein ACXACA_04380 [Candidatus Ranarchaeia archaeon]|jgi:hypothetical protein
MSKIGILSPHEEIVWQRFQQGQTTGAISNAMKAEKWTPAYVSRVLNRARDKIGKVLREHARSLRLDIESVLDYKGLLLGFDYAANSQVYIVFTRKMGIIVWYKHASYAGKLCPECPKKKECRDSLDIIMDEYYLQLRPDEEQSNMTEQAIAIFNKLAAKEIPRYKRN